MTDGSRKAIFAAFFANLGIAIAKFVVAFLSRSSAMMSEAVHSFADSGNQLFLLLGMRRAGRAEDAIHEFGYAAERRMERRLIGEYQDLILKLADSVTDRTLPVATEMAAAAAEIKGYGPVKEAGVETYRGTIAKLMAGFEKPPEEDAPTRARVSA